MVEVELLLLMSMIESTIVTGVLHAYLYECEGGAAFYATWASL